MPRISLQNLSKDFPSPNGSRICAVDDLNLEIGDGEWLVLVGPSGCGKTTTLRLVADLEHPTKGAVFMDGANLNGVAARDRDVAMLFQNGALYPHLTCFENLAFGLEVRKIPAEEIRKRVEEVARKLGIQACLSRMPAEISAGQRQRVALGRALVRRPAAFLLDEPLANLDVPNRERLRAELLQLRAETRTTTLYVTHDQQEALSIGHRLAVLNGGKLQQVGAPAEVYERPANLFVAGFFGSPAMNLIPGTTSRLTDGLSFALNDSGSTVCLKLRQSPLQLMLNENESRAIVLGVRPEHLQLEGSARNSGCTLFDATVTACELTGPDKLLKVQISGTTMMLTLRVATAWSGSVGDTVEVSAAEENLRFFDAATEQAIG